MKTYYAFLITLLYVSASYPGWEEQISDYTDDFIFCQVKPRLTDNDRNDIYERLFDLTTRK